VILRAMKERRDIEIRYHSLIRDEVSDRTITPIEIGEDNGQETLFAYCSKAKAFRTFRLDNFLSATISEQESSNSQVDQVQEDVYTAQFKINARLRTTLERFRLDTPVISPKQGELYEVKSFSQDWLLRNFLSTMGNTQIVDSPELAQLVAEKARVTLDLYRSKLFA